MCRGPGHTEEPQDQALEDSQDQAMVHYWLAGAAAGGGSYRRGVGGQGEQYLKDNYTFVGEPVNIEALEGVLQTELLKPHSTRVMAHDFSPQNLSGFLLNFNLHLFKLPTIQISL